MKPDQPSRAGTEKAPKPMFGVSDLMQDGHDIFMTLSGKQMKFHRATPMGVAYTNLQSAGQTEYWRLALDKGPQKGMKMPAESANTVETPKRPSWFARIFRSKEAEPAKPELPGKFFIPGIPDYAGSAEALGIQVDAVVQAIVVSETGACITMTDGQKITAEPKSDLARSVAVLLEEFDAIGHNHAKARDAVNGPLGRPIVRMPQFGNAQKPRNKLSVSKKREAASTTSPGPVGEQGEPEYITASESAPLDMGENVEDSVDYREGPGVIRKEVRKLTPIASPDLRRDDRNPKKRELPELEKRDSAAPAKLAETRTQNQTGEDLVNSADIEQASELPVAQQKPQGANESAEASPESNAPVDEVGNSEGNQSEERIGRDPIEEELGVQMPEVAGASRADESGQKKELAGYVRIGQRARPKPEGPFTLEARSQEKVDGKYKSITQFNVPKKDYAVIAWLAQKRIEATYKISVAQPDDQVEQGIPEAVIEEVQVKNEAGFVALNWQQCREEFEKANNLTHRPELQDALKSASIETATTTTSLPGIRQPALPDKRDVADGMLPLPKLRPVIVPVAPEGGHAFS